MLTLSVPVWFDKEKKKKPFLSVGLNSLLCVQPIMVFDDTKKRLKLEYKKVRANKA